MLTLVPRNFAFMRLAIALLLAVANTTAAGAAEEVNVGEGAAALNSVLYRPAGKGPFETVIALHGCGGLLTSSGKITSRYADWAARLSSAGIAVLFPDSFTPRGLGAQCRVRERKVRSARERVADAYVAKQWVQGQPWSLKNRVSVMGWSSGAIASL